MTRPARQGGDPDDRGDRQAPAGTPPGTLYVVGTPIGNLEDITLRALRVLKGVDWVACEDTRRTRQLFAHYGIRTPVVSYHEHNEARRAAELVVRMAEGARIAVVSDAGMPLLSDPGYRLVELAVRRGIRVVPIPGPSALVAALAGAGLPAGHFLFVGFLPARKNARRRALAQLARRKETLVFFEAPHRIIAMLEDALEALGDRPATLGRELTKVHEEFLRGRISEILARLREQPVRGEITLVIAPGEPEEKSKREAPRTIRQELDELMAARGLDERAALKAWARAQGLSKSEAYRRLQREKISGR